MSNSNTCAAEGPRPWYVSVTVLWRELDRFEELRDAIWPFLRPGRLPVHHLPVPCESWHSTVFAVLQIDCSPTEKKASANFADQVFTRLLGKPGVDKKLRKLLRSLTLQPYEVRCFDDGTTVQFEENEDLEKLRASLRAFFNPRVEELKNLRSPVRTLVKELRDDSPKRSGPRLWGSFARSPSRLDSNLLRWREKLVQRPTLECHSFHLLVSDNALTNPRQLGENDLLFPTNQRT